MSDGIRLISLNTRGISHFQKRRTVFNWCRRKKADVIFLQETHSKKELESQWRKEWGTEMVFSHGSPNARGVAILLNKGVDYCIHSKIIDPLGRFIIVKVEIEDNLYVLINVYAPNKDKEMLNSSTIYYLLYVERIWMPKKILLLEEILISP